MTERPKREDFDPDKKGQMAFARAIAAWNRENRPETTGLAAVAQPDPEPVVEPAPEPPPPPKRGKSAWGATAPLIVRNMDPTKHYTWGLRDENEVERYQDLGLKPVTRGAQRREGGESVHDGRPLTSVKTFRELALYEMPKELREAQMAYIAEEAERPLREIERNAKQTFQQQAGGRLPVKTSLVIS